MTKKFKKKTCVYIQEYVCHRNKIIEPINSHNILFVVAIKEGVALGG
jgi:hypothetical protein